MVGATHCHAASPEDAEGFFGEDGEDVVAEVGNNADLYAANQENTD